LNDTTEQEVWGDDGSSEASSENYYKAEKTILMGINSRVRHFALKEHTCVARFRGNMGLGVEMQ
jgi:hypothetical protein